MTEYYYKRRQKAKIGKDIEMWLKCEIEELTEKFQWYESSFLIRLLQLQDDFNLSKAFNLTTIVPILYLNGNLFTW
jgi:hypothetical protein